MRRALALALVATALACDTPGGALAPRTTVAVTGPTSAAPRLVGTWQRTLYFLDDFGIARASETTWQFTADGIVTRALVVRNLTFGLVDVQVSAGRYRVDGTRLTVDFVSPAPAQLVLEVRRVGNQLELAGQSYLLVGG